MEFPLPLSAKSRATVQPEQAPPAGNDLAHCAEK
jgi:hypothetical protein